MESLSQIVPVHKSTSTLERELSSRLYPDENDTHFEMSVVMHEASTLGTTGKSNSKDLNESPSSPKRHESTATRHSLHKQKSPTKTHSHHRRGSRGSNSLQEQESPTKTHSHHKRGSEASLHSPHRQKSAAGTHSPHRHESAAGTHSNHRQESTAGTHSPHRPVSTAETHSPHRQESEARTHSPHRQESAAGTHSPHRQDSAAGTHSPHRQESASGTHSPHRQESTPGTHSPHRPVSVAGTHSPHKQESTAGTHSPHRQESAAKTHSPHRQESAAKTHSPQRQESAAGTHSPHRQESTVGTHSPHRQESTARPHSPHRQESAGGTHSPHRQESTAGTHSPHRQESTAATHSPHRQGSAAGTHSPHRQESSAKTHSPHRQESTAKPHSPHRHESTAGTHSPHRQESTAGTRSSQPHESITVTSPIEAALSLEVQEPPVGQSLPEPQQHDPPLREAPPVPERQESPVGQPPIEPQKERSPTRIYSILRNNYADPKDPREAMHHETLHKVYSIDGKPTNCINKPVPCSSMTPKELSSPRIPPLSAFGKKNLTSLNYIPIWYQQAASRSSDWLDGAAYYARKYDPSHQIGAFAPKVNVETMVKLEKRKRRIKEVTPYSSESLKKKSIMKKNDQTGSRSRASSQGGKSREYTVQWFEASHPVRWNTDVQTEPTHQIRSAPVFKSTPKVHGFVDYIEDIYPFSSGKHRAPTQSSVYTVSSVSSGMATTNFDTTAYNAEQVNHHQSCTCVIADCQCEFTPCSAKRTKNTERDLGSTPAAPMVTSTFDNKAFNPHFSEPCTCVIADCQCEFTPCSAKQKTHTKRELGSTPAAPMVTTPLDNKAVNTRFNKPCSCVIEDCKCTFAPCSGKNTPRNERDLRTVDRCLNPSELSACSRGRSSSRSNGMSTEFGDSFMGDHSRIGSGRVFVERRPSAGDINQRCECTTPYCYCIYKPCASRERGKRKLKKRRRKKPKPFKPKKHWTIDHDKCILCHIKAIEKPFSWWMRSCCITWVWHDREFIRHCGKKLGELPDYTEKPPSLNESALNRWWDNRFLYDEYEPDDDNESVEHVNTK